MGDGTHGRAEPIQTFRCQACHPTFSARRHTPLYRLKTPAHQIAMVLAALAEGRDLSAAERVFGDPSDHHYHLAVPGSPCTRRPCTSAPSATYISHTCSWTKFEHCSAAIHGCVFPWLAIDPCTKLLPVLELGPRTQHMAHSVIHSLRQMLAPGCLPLFTSDGLNGSTSTSTH